MSAPAFDLQSHSLHSDGDLSAAQVVECAAEAGVKLLALSDHDTIDGVDEALASGEGNRPGQNGPAVVGRRANGQGQTTITNSYAASSPGNRQKPTRPTFKNGQW